MASTSRYVRTVMMVLVAGSCALLTLAYPGVRAQGHHTNHAFIPPRPGEKLGPEVLDALRKEQKRHRNEAVIDVPLADGTTGILATFGDFTMLMRPEGKGALSMSIFRGEELVQRIDTVYYLSDKATKTLEANTTVKNVGTEHRLVSELRIAQTPPERCSFVLDGLTTVAHHDSEDSERRSVSTRIVFDMCKEVIEEFVLDGSLPDEVVGQFDFDSIRTGMRLLLEDTQAFETLDLLVPETTFGILREPQQGFTVGLGGGITRRCFLAIGACAIFKSPRFCAQWFICALDVVL